MRYLCERRSKVHPYYLMKAAEKVMHVWRMATKGTEKRTKTRLVEERGSFESKSTLLSLRRSVRGGETRHVDIEISSS